MVRCTILAAMSALALAGMATAQEEGQEAIARGAGTNSCGWHLASVENQREGFQWAFGFWTGASIYSGTPGIGPDTDYLGFQAEVDRRCREQPMTSLLNVVYAIIQEGGVQ